MSNVNGCPHFDKNVKGDYFNVFIMTPILSLIIGNLYLQEK